MQRFLQPEWLDMLDPEDARAIRSRRDLRWVNAWMGNARIMARSMRGIEGMTRAQRLVDIGAGDGSFIRKVIELLGVNGETREAVLIDRQTRPEAEAARQIRAFGWRLDAVQGDVFDWLGQPPGTRADVMVANLFLHHFQNTELRTLLAMAARHTRAFVACEPRRSRVGLAATRLLGLIGCNGVTRHDAVASVRAGFRDQELSELWPAGAGWRLSEQPAGPFSHCFVAQAPENCAAT